MSSALLTHNCVCWGLVANGCLPAIWEQDPGFLGYSECLYMIPWLASGQIQPKTIGEWANHASFMLPIFL